MLGKIIHSADHAKMIHEVAGKIEKLKNRINEIYNNKLKYDFQDNESTSMGEDTQRWESINRLRRNVEEDDVVGFIHDSGEVIPRLMEGGSHSRLNVVSIIGMGGLGKTSLARKIYNNNQVKIYCHCCANVSNDYRPRELLLSLLECLISISQDVCSWSEDKLKNKVRECLKGKRYLVVLDDIWKTQHWDEIRHIFPDDGNASRVLIASRLSRLKDIASYTGRIPPYYLPFLNADESWQLFHKKVFWGEDCPADLETLVRKIAESCHGLPLSIVVLSGLLANKEKSLREWSRIMGHVNWYLTRDETQVKDIVLKLSYDSLPRRLKPCFLYFGVFPEDFEVRVRPLIQKWVAEGFIQQTGTRNPKDVAEDYLYELVDRSLIQVAKRRSDGGAQTCRIHDLLRDLCIYEAEKDKFFELWMDTNILTRARAKPRRLSVHCSAPSRVSSSNCDHSCTRSLICFNEEGRVFTSDHWKWIVKGFQLVRVLEIGQDLWFFSISSKLGALIHLRYLKIDFFRGSGIIVIPYSICNLWNLETLDLGPPRLSICLGFPSGMWNLKKLKHLHSAKPLILSDFSGSDTKITWNLQTLSHVALNKATTSLIQKGMFPNLRKLNLFIMSEHKWKPQQVLQSFKHLTHLNTLCLILDYYNYEYKKDTRHASLFQFKADTFPSSITKITFRSAIGLDTNSMKTIANLANLQVLKLHGFGSRFGDSFDLNFFPRWFPQLQVFEMRKLEVHNWLLANGAMPCLQRLVIKDCRHLVCLPNELWSLTALRQVQVFKPSKELTSCSKI